jgi:primosomal protein N' (replication factor Y)
MPNRVARALRQASTDAEIRLWAALRGRRLAAFKFRRQHSIGRFVVDFAGTRHHLVIEAAGGQHADREADAERTKWLERQGWRIRRFWNNDILANTEAVLETIPEALCAS